MKLSKFICILLIFAHHFVGAQTLEKLAATFGQHPAIRGGTIGIAIMDCQSGSNLMAENASSLLAPASTLKVVTTATALEILGPEYRFQTVMGFTGSISGKILDGNLVFVGGGDPTLGSSWFANGEPADSFLSKWITELAKRGIDSIRGDIVVCAHRFDDDITPGSWAWEDLGNYYGASPSALSLFDNTIRLSFDSPSEFGQKVILSGTTPPDERIRWVNEVVSSPVNQDRAYVFGSPWGDKRVITGTIPAGRKNFEVKASLPDPLTFSGEFFRNTLIKAGIGIAGNSTVTLEPVSVTPLSLLVSPPLSEIIKITNHESVNLFADHLAVQLGLEKKGEGNMDAGLEVIKKFWKERGVSDSLFMEDGSGLSRYTAITPEFIARLLCEMKKSRYRTTFESSLPAAGTGTLVSFSRESFPGTALRAKSGSLQRVRCYAGYLICQSGREVAFSIMVNNFPGSSADVVRQIQSLLLNVRKSL